MKPENFQDPPTAPDAAIDELLRVRPLAPQDFTARTLAAVRARARRARLIRFSAWTGSLAASLALLLGAAARWQTAHDAPVLASAPQPMEVASISEEVASPAIATADDLTRALYQAINQDDVVFYGHALALEDILADAAALTEEDSRETLDILLLFAQH